MIKMSKVLQRTLINFTGQFSYHLLKNKIWDFLKNNKFINDLISKHPLLKL